MINKKTTQNIYVCILKNHWRSYGRNWRSYLQTISNP